LNAGEPNGEPVVRLPTSGYLPTDQRLALGRHSLIAAVPRRVIGGIDVTMVMGVTMGSA
jgi:hypothetical protein